MKDFFVGLWTDETKFRGAMRGLGILVAGLIMKGIIPLPGAFDGWVADLIPLILGTGSAMIPAGQRNPK